jgi:hypothetical protein
MFFSILKAVNACMSDVEAQGAMAVNMRLQMKKSPRFEIPLVCLHVLTGGRNGPSLVPSNGSIPLM